MGLGPDAELLVNEEVIPWAAGAGTTGSYCVGDTRCGATPVCDGLTAGFGDEVYRTGAENVIEVRYSRGFGAIKEGVVTSYDIRALFDAGTVVDLEEFLHTSVVLSMSG